MSTIYTSDYKMVRHPSGDGLAIYKRGELLKAGHTDDVLEWFVESHLELQETTADFITIDGGWNAYLRLADVPS